MKKESGITLVALVITVIIMLILAGVSLSLITGEDGLFARTNHAAGLYEDASRKDAEIMNELLKNINAMNSEESKKHYIYDKEDLEEFRDNVNAGNSYKDEVVILMDDIDLGGKQEDEATWWAPIGSYDSNWKDKEFEGTFDGNDYSITGLYGEIYEGNGSLSFFTHLNNAEIKDLTVDGEFIVGGNNDNASLAVAGLANTVSGNCKITNCKNSIDVQKLSSGKEAGGIVGSVTGILTIENCINEGTISGANNCGGLVGGVFGTIIINNSWNTGEITNLYGNYVGGLIGRDGQGDNIDITINNSYNIGNITGINRIGGLAGRLGYGINLKLTVNNCYNNGEITLEGSDGSVGGLIGQIVNNSNPCNVLICNSWNMKDIAITLGGGNTGGIVGDILGGKNVNIINCYNRGNVAGVTASGIVGRIRDTDDSNPVLNIINSYNSGEMAGSIYSAGIVRIQHVTAKVDIINTYYSDKSALKGVESNEPIHAPEVKEDAYMKEEAFVNELNSNIGSIESEIELKKWNYKEGEYPVLADN